jgi:hypothetical protein
MIRLTKCLFACATVAGLLFGSARNSQADMIVTAYGQNVHALSQSPFGFSDGGGYAPGPASTGTSGDYWGYASITSSSFSTSSINMSYSLSSPSGGFYGHDAHADQNAYFHVNTDTLFTESLSNSIQTLSLPNHATEELFSYLSDLTTHAYVYYDHNYNGISLHNSGMLIAGHDYLYYAIADQGGDFPQTTQGSAVFSTSSPVPEPSTCVLMVCGGIGLGFRAIRRSRQVATV